MKIAICSDLHLEFDLFKPDSPIFKNEEQADVLILGGDILVANHLTEDARYGKGRKAHREFFKMCSENYKNVIYLMGNHEHYNGDFKYTPGIIFSLVAEFDNVHFLDKETVKIDNVIFAGGTMWTDFNKEDPLTLHSIANKMNDFRCVENSNSVVNYKTFEDKENPDKPTFKTRAGRFSPEDALEDHKKFLGFLKSVLDNTITDKVVVCTHHTPSHASCHPRYANDSIMNGGYHSDLSELILNNPQIKLWTHGHTHELFDYMIGSTRIVCNPRGYHSYEDIADTFKLKIVDV